MEQICLSNLAQSSYKAARSLKDRKDRKGIIRKEEVAKDRAEELRRIHDQKDPFIHKQRKSSANSILFGKPI